MANASLKLTANFGGQAGGVTILSPTASTAYVVLSDGLDWGNLDPAFVLAKRRDGVVKALVPTFDPRVITIPLRITATTRDLLTAAKATLGREARACARAGGVLRWQGNGASFAVNFRIVDAKIAFDEGAQSTESVQRTRAALQLVTDPVAYGDAMTFTDGFDTDTVTGGDYTADAGAGTLSVVNGVLVPSSTAAKRYRHTARGYAYSDVQATVRVNTGAVVTAGDWAVGIRADTAGADTMIAARLSTAAAQLQITSIAAGVVTAIATAAFTPLAATSYWLRVRAEGQLVVAELFTTEPTPTSTPAATASGVLTAAQLVSTGHVVLRITPAGTDETYDDVAVSAYTYRSSIVTPDVVRLAGIPGDLPALVDVDVTQPAAVASAAAWGMVAWATRPAPYDLVYNGGFETDTNGVQPVGWTAAAIAGVQGAATSILADNTAKKYGTQSAKIVCPATSGTGAAFPVYRTFRRGAVYCACAWKWAAAGTTAAKLVLGVSGDQATSTGAALSVAPVFEVAVWRPTATVSAAYVSAQIGAATATTWNIDGVDVWEAVPATLSGTITNVATSLVVTSQPVALPNTPFFAVIDNEIVQVTAAASTTWTITRGVDGTTAAGHTAGAGIYVWPTRDRTYVEGAVAAGTCDVVDAENAAVLSNLSITVDANARGGNKLAPSSLQTSFAATWLVDPGVLTPRDYSDAEQLLEVWARVELASTLSIPRIVLSTTSEDGVAFGGTRYDIENGSTGMSPTLPSTGTVWRFLRIGVVPVKIDANSRRRRVSLTLTASVSVAVSSGLSIDYVVLVDPAARVSTPTGVADTAGVYPEWFGSTAEATRRISSDLSTSMSRPPRGFLQSGGVIGAPIVAGPGAVDAVVKLSRLIPNDTTSLATTEDGSAANSPSYANVAVSFAVTPRYLVIR